MAEKPSTGTDDANEELWAGIGWVWASRDPGLVTDEQGVVFSGVFSPANVMADVGGCPEGGGRVWNMARWLAKVPPPVAWCHRDRLWNRVGEVAWRA